MQAANRDELINQIWELLAQPEQVSIPMPERAIAKACGLTGDTGRTIRKAVRTARTQQNPLPICSCPQGYYAATSAAQIRECGRRLRIRAIHQLETARDFKRSIPAMIGAIQTLFPFGVVYPSAAAKQKHENALVADGVESEA